MTAVGRDGGGQSGSSPQGLDLQQTGSSKPNLVGRL
jgi:hypothetical protein